MLRITKFSDKACFLTGVKSDDVVEVRFTDKSFTGSLSWSALLDVLKRKAAETPPDNEQAGHREERASPPTRGTAEG